ncbi:MAG: hypothetical protein JW944_05130 [Deltaproteobacteria bacterium]|nr:hypothetical protein [Deltaproteobacteria bacterium]
MFGIRKHKESPIPFDLSVNRETIFSDYKKKYRKGIESRQRSMLKMLPFLNTFLVECEEIFLVTTACSPVSFIERFWTGLNVFDLKRSILVFTDRRIFHVPVTGRYSYKNSIAHFYYSDCKSLRVKGLTLIAVYKNGVKERFHHIAVREEKKLKALLKFLPLEASCGRTKGRVHLCPRCTEELEEGRFICGNCGLKFKDKATARKISILYPGGGYFYTGHPCLGFGDIGVEIILLGFFVLSFIFNRKGVSCCVWGMYIFPMALLFEKMLTVYHSNILVKEYIPKRKDMGAI